MAPLFDAAIVVVNVVDFDRDAINLLAGFDDAEEDGRLSGIGDLLPLNTAHLTQQVLQTNEPLSLAGDHSKTESMPLILPDRSMDAVLMVPLRSSGESLGVLGIMRDESGTEFDEEDVLLV